MAAEYAYHTIGVRPEDVSVFGEAGEGRVKATAIQRTNLPLKNIAILKMRVGENQVVATVPIVEGIRVGDEVGLELRKFHVFEKKAGARIKTVASA